MLVLRKNSSNTIRVSLAELSTLSNPVYLIEFISDTSLISTTCIAPDTSSYPARYNEFTITEQTSPDGLLAQILLEPVGFFTYNIYEQTSATNLAPNAPGTVLLETGKARVLIDGDRQSTAFSYYQNPTQDFHAWDVFNSEGISPAPPSTDATYQNSDSSFTQVIAPGVTYTAPDISFTDSDGSVSNVPANTNVVCTPAAIPYSNVYSMQLDGIDEGITYPSYTALNLTANAFTISLWCKGVSGGASNCRLFDRRFLYIQHTGVNRIRCRINQTAGSFQTFETGSVNIFDDAWHHVMVTYEIGGQARIYLDGVRLVNSSTTLTGFLNASSTIGMGCNYLASSSFFNGKIDEVAYWNTLDLSGANALIYNSGTPSDLAAFNPDLWIRMGDDGTWTGALWQLPNEGLTTTDNAESINMEETDRTTDVP